MNLLTQKLKSVSFAKVLDKKTSLEGHFGLKMTDLGLDLAKLLFRKKIQTQRGQITLFKVSEWWGKRVFKFPVNFKFLYLFKVVLYNFYFLVQFSSTFSSTTLNFFTIFPVQIREIQGETFYPLRKPTFTKNAIFKIFFKNPGLKYNFYFLVQFTSTLGSTTLNFFTLFPVQIREIQGEYQKRPTMQETTNRWGFGVL